MHISRFLFPLIALLCPQTGLFAQDSIRTNFPPGRIEKTVTLLIPKGDLLIREQYRDWRSNFWFFWTDTLTETENGMLTGRLGTIDPTTFIYVESCDPVIRRIRNETLMRRIGDEYDDEIAGLAPVLSAEDSLAMPTAEDELFLCPDAFADKARKWQGIQMAGRQKALILRSIRAEWVRSVIEKGHTEHLDSVFFAGFLEDFSWNPIDGKTFLLLAEHRTDALLEACSRLSKKHFRSVCVAVEQSTKTLNTAEAITRLEASEVKGKRKRQLVKSMRHR